MSHMACITNDRNRQAGRTGMGAVMGSKNLKSVAFRGTKGVKVAKPAEFYKLAKKWEMSIYLGNFTLKSLRRNGIHLLIES